MVDWMSEAEIAHDSDVFSKFMHALLGLYLWEWATSLPFDIDYVRGKRKFKWPLIFYFLNRYCLLMALIGIAIALNVTERVNCQGLYTFNQCFGNAAIGLASINLSLRTMAIWSQKWYIVVPLVCIILGHWSLLLHGILLKAVYVPGQGCAITQTDSKILAATFIYTMAFDFTVLSLTAWKLIFPAGGRSRLVSLIFNDGLIYFLVAFIANLIATTFMLLNLNPVMSIIANVPAAIASTIVACRVVRRLNKYNAEGPEVFACVSDVGSVGAYASSRSAYASGTGAYLPPLGPYISVERAYAASMGTYGPSLGTPASPSSAYTSPIDPYGVNVSPVGAYPSPVDGYPSSPLSATSSKNKF